MAGRMAEKLIMGDISTGASNDIQRATGIARNMVTRYGMSDDLGPIVYGSEHSSDEVFLGRDFSSGRNYSEETASLIDNEIKRIIGDAYKKAEDILRERIDKLHFVAQFLIKDEIMDEEQFKAAMTGDPTVEELEEMLSERRRRSNRENEEKASATRRSAVSERKKIENALKLNRRIHMGFIVRTVLNRITKKAAERKTMTLKMTRFLKT